MFFLPASASEIVVFEATVSSSVSFPALVGVDDPFTFELFERKPVDGTARDTNDMTRHTGEGSGAQMMPPLRREADFTSLILKLRIRFGTSFRHLPSTGSMPTDALARIYVNSAK